VRRNVEIDGASYIESQHGTLVPRDGVGWMGQGSEWHGVALTGLATGPHVHYEYRVNGVHKNPARVTMPKADPIPANLMADFKAQTAPLLARLDAESASAVQVASATAGVSGASSGGK